jgi:hypothetical protein
MIKLEYCQYKPDGCKHSSRPITIKVVGDIQTRKIKRIVKKSNEPYCNDLGCSVCELPACPRDLKIFDIPVGMFPESARRWIEPKKKRRRNVA